jgi:hypothetical protein
VLPAPAARGAKVLLMMQLPEARVTLELLGKYLLSPQQQEQLMQAVSI